LPIYGRAYSAGVLKGRRARDERAVIKRAFQLLVQYVALKRIRLTADRGFAEVGLFTLIDPWGLRFVIRGKSSPKGGGKDTGARGVACVSPAIPTAVAWGGEFRVKVHRPGFGSISAVPATQAVTGRSGIGSPIRPTGRVGRGRNTVAASVAKKVFATLKGIWASNRHVLLVSRLGHDCLPGWRSPFWC
jgi:hypothetical protein